MTVIDRKPVPIYEAECGECHSIIQYRATEVHFTGYITCPVCGKSVWANTINPVRMQSVSNGDNLRSLTDEELADIFKKLCCPFCFDEDFVGKCGPKGGCKQCWLDWLKREAE